MPRSTGIEVSREVVIRGKNYTDADLDQLKSRLLRVLKRELCEVRFLKKDGTKRTMVCTLRKTFMPKRVAEEVDTGVKRKMKEGVLPVWVIETANSEVGEFRSFRLDSFLRLTVLG